MDVVMDCFENGVYFAIALSVRHTPHGCPTLDCMVALHFNDLVDEPKLALMPFITIVMCDSRRMKLRLTELLMTFGLPRVPLRSPSIHPLIIVHPDFSSMPIMATDANCGKLTLNAICGKQCHTWHFVCPILKARPTLLPKSFVFQVFFTFVVHNERVG